MKRSTLGMLSILIALAAILLTSPGAYALDPPHNAYDTSNGYSITCSSCHYDVTTSSTPSWMTAPTTTFTQMDNLCLSCHSAGKFSDTLYADMGTHASVNTSNKYGNWYLECRTCHNPHYQQQAENYPGDPTADIVTGTVVSLSTSPGAAQSSMVVSGVTLTASALINELVIPNTKYPTRMYRIVSNTNNSITVYGALNPNYAAAGSTFAVRFGKLIKDKISTPNSGIKTVKFFTDVRTQPNSFASSTDKATATGVCQVCHTQTKYFNSSLTSTYPVTDVSTSHSGAGSSPCSTCHTHKAGFSPIGGCTGCHGSPPVDASTLVYASTPSQQTGQTTAGAHLAHAVSMGYACTTCHDNGMPATPTPDQKIEMGFNLFSGARIGGNYVTRASLSNGYTYTAGNGSTTLSAPGVAMTCNTIYCHSNVQNPATGVGAPTSYGTPSWAGAVQCGDCHLANGTQGNKSLMNSGSHTKHVTTTTYAVACSTCHLNAGEGTALHVNNAIDVNFDATKAGTGNYSGSPAPGAGYGTCSATYCHGNFNGGTNANTATWGNAASGACGTCHGASATTPPVNGAHSAHASTPGYAFGCNLCHYSTSTTGTTITSFTNHVNQKTEWQLSPSDSRTTGALYKGAASGSNANVGTGYGTCSNLYCHTQGTASASPYVSPNTVPDWSASATFPNDCTGCHDADKSAANKMHTGSHTAHVVSSGQTCNLCHSGTVGTTAMTITDYTKHVNKTVSIAFTSLNPSGRVNGVATLEKVPGSAMATCATLYCHGAGTPTWGGASLNCASCHKANNTLAGKHSMHYGVTTTATTADKTIASSSPTGTFYKFSCDVCHDANATVHAGGPVNSVRAAEVAFDPTIAGGGTYSAGGTNLGPDSGFNWTGGSCSATYCHSQGTTATGPYSAPNVTPTWNTAALDCAACHGNSANSSKLITSGAHSAHLNDSVKNKVGRNLMCTDCHNATASTTTDFAISSASYHVNKQVNIKFNNASINKNTDNPKYEGLDTTVASGAAVTAGGGSNQCSNVYCHSIGNLTTSGGAIAPVSGGVVSFRTPTWTNATGLTCDSCHGDQAGKSWPTYASGGTNTYTSNSHPKHIESANHNCSICHNGTTVSTVTSASTMTLVAGGTHLNRIEDVSFATIGSKTGSYDPATKTCSATYCHGTPPSVAWGGSTNCGSCHKANSTLPGKHALHYGSTTTAADQSAANNSTTTNYVFNCGVCHFSTSHATGPVSGVQTANISFDSTIAGSGTYTPGGVSAGTDSSGWSWTAGTCSATYCHSQGTVGTAPYSTPNVTNFTWNSSAGTLDCSGCHTGGTVSGPTYTNLSPKANSHNKHVVVNGYTCDKCHYATTTTGTTITNESKHVDKLYEVQASPAVSFTVTAGNFTTATQCSNISCHGGTTATVTWGQTNIVCSSCHLAANDLRNDTYGDGIVATISSTQWLYSGHGKTTGLYDATSNSAANFTGSNPCLYCHDDTVAHGNGTNVYRLRTSSTGTFMNDVCWNCHATGSAGVTPPSMANKNAVNKIDKYHFGAEHASTKTGGEFCWDCHTAHGDSTSTAGPIAMFRNRPWMQSGPTGTPITMVSTTITFTSLTNFNSFATVTSPNTYPSLYGGNVCNLCHDATKDPTMTHYNITGSDKHNYGVVCTQCHSHSGDTTKDGGAFAGAGGACNSCHSYPPVIGDGKAYIGSAQLGKGAHTQHVNEIMSSASYTWGALDPNNDTFSSPKVAAVCGVCHDTSAAANHPNVSNKAVMLIPTFYQFGPSAPVYNGDPTTATNKNCSNVSCHFQASPLWQQTANQ